MMDDYKVPIVDLFPYKFKDRSLFYDRDHPVIDPDNPLYQDYWREKVTNYIKGRWVYDKDSWVYMPGKLDFYVNYGKVAFYGTDIRHPDLRAVEWIIFTYLMGVDGFSGFEKDEKYTSFFLIKDLEEGLELDEVQMRNIPESAKLPDGSGYKKFVHPWEYLTRTYLIDDKPSSPLGDALFLNRRKNGALVTCRSLGKSRSLFVGDMGYEHLLGDCKDLSDFGKNRMPLNFLAVAGDAGVLTRSIKAFRLFYENQPGKYSKPNPLDPKKELTWDGVLYKRLQGEWEAQGGSKLEHIVKRKDGFAEIVGNSLEFRSIGEGKFKVGAGDRFRRFYCEEAGLTDPIAFWRFIKDSMKVGDSVIGSYLALGTSGDMKLVQPLAKMVNNPDAYDIFSIPDYWRNPEKRMAMFIPTPYGYREYYDPQGNLLVEAAYGKFFRERAKARKEMDGASYESEVMHNPGTPDELLRPSNDSLFPKAEAQRQRNIIESSDLFDKFAIGDFEFNPTRKYGVEFEKDLTFTRKPILDYYIDRGKIDMRGAPVVYEFPDEGHIPKNVYWVIYDPAMKSGQGESLHSILVYKWLEPGRPDSLQDTIVAEWIGRYDSLEKNYEQVVKMARFYNAKIFPETNTPGFVDYCIREGHWDLLEPDAYYLEQEIHGNKNIKRNHYRVGYQMTEKKKFWCDQKIPGYLKETRHSDPVTGIPTLRTIDWIFSMRMLDEIIHHNDNDNFDHISTLRGIVLLREKLIREDYALEVQDKEDDLNRRAVISRPTPRIERRPSILKY